MKVLCYGSTKFFQDLRKAFQPRHVLSFLSLFIFQSILSLSLSLKFIYLFVSLFLCFTPILSLLYLSLSCYCCHVHCILSTASLLSKQDALTFTAWGEAQSTCRWKLCRNKAILLVKTSHVTYNILSWYFISAQVAQFMYGYNLFMTSSRLQFESIFNSFTRLRFLLQIASLACSQLRHC